MSGATRPRDHLVRNNILWNNTIDITKSSGVAICDHNLASKFAGMTCANGKTANPQFVSANDFHLQKGSPAIDTGVALSEVAVDITGAKRPMGSGYDMGAYEYGGAPPPACVASVGAWQNETLSAETGTFTVEFDATPKKAGMNGVVGLSNGPADGYTDLAAIVRFNSQGKIDVRKGSGYAADTEMPYSAGTRYRVRMIVDMAKHAYSVYVMQGTGSEQLLAQNYAFRTEQAAVAKLDNLGVFATSTSSAQVCNVTTK